MLEITVNIIFFIVLWAGVGLVASGVWKVLWPSTYNQSNPVKGKPYVLGILVLIEILATYPWLREPIHHVGKNEETVDRKTEH